MNKFVGLGLMVVLAIISSTSAGDTCKLNIYIIPYYDECRNISCFCLGNDVLLCCPLWNI